MGALTFEPADPLALSAGNVKLLDLAREAQALIQGCDRRQRGMADMSAEH
jgi:hypothetical protein